jgi:outer membrane protein OmpU
MNNLKKLGLTALAGTLASTSAFAGALDVSGTAKVKYTSHDNMESTGNPFVSDKGISFSGSGEMDNGMTVSYGYLMTDAAFSSTSVKLDMGDAGMIGIGNGTDIAGIGKYDDVMPTAGEEVLDDVDGTDSGVVDHSNVNQLGYEGSFIGSTVSVAYTKAANASGSDKSIVILSDSLMDGLQLGYGQGDKGGAVGAETDHATAWAKYTSGPVTIGFQASKIDNPTSSSDEDRNHLAASFAINENLSVSYGISAVEFGDPTLSDEDSSGVSASYTTGSITVGVVANKTEAVGGVSATDDTFTEVAVTFAF